MNDDDYQLNSTLGLSTRGGHYHLDEEQVWASNMQEVRDYLSRQVSTKMDLDVIEKIKAMIEAPKNKSKEEKVIDIVNGGFERHFGMTIQEFQETFEAILKSNPEKLL